MWQLMTLLLIKTTCLLSIVLPRIAEAFAEAGKTLEKYGTRLIFTDFYWPLSKYDYCCRKTNAKGKIKTINSTIFE